MPTQSVYMPWNQKPYYKVEEIELNIAAKSSSSSKKKSKQSLHTIWLTHHPHQKLLNISSKSESTLGQALSPLSLNWEVPFLKKSFCIESIFQASKVFKQGGPYVDLFGASGIEAKKDPRLKNSGPLVHYLLQEKKFPSSPPVLFYNWLYIQGLLDHPALAAQLFEFDGFSNTDINSKHEDHCPAKACAMYVSLAKLKQTNQLRNFEFFKALFLSEELFEIQPQRKDAQPTQKMNDFAKSGFQRTIFSPGQWLFHPTIGRGQVIRRTNKEYVINFKISGPKSINKEYVERYCKAVDA